MRITRIHHREDTQELAAALARAAAVGLDEAGADPITDRSAVARAAAGAA